MKIRLFKPMLGQKELKNIAAAFKRAWIGLGPLVSEFETAWKTYLGCRAALAVNSATAALHLAVSAYEFPAGKKVLVPALTFAATAFAPVYNRLEPVFVDSDPNTLSLSMSDLEKKYSPACVAVMPVHFGGHPAPMDQIVGFARARGLRVIEDCAHTAGAVYNGVKLGNWGDMGCFSFEEKKAMTTGDGGMIVSGDLELIEQLRPARWVGIDKDTWKRAAAYTNQADLDTRHWYYEITRLGYKYNMNDLAAAIGLAQLEKLDQMNRKRSHCLRRYLDGMKGLRIIKPLLPFEPEKYSYWLFGVRVPCRDRLIGFLKGREIATGVHYIPLHLQKFFKPFASDCPLVEKLWLTFVTLPLHAGLTRKEIDYVLTALYDFEKEL